MLESSSAHPFNMSSEQKSVQGRVQVVSWIAHACRPRPLSCLDARLTSEIGIIDLHVANPGRIEHLELLLISLGDIGEIRIVIRIHAGKIGLAGTVPEMVPRRAR